MKLIDSNIIVYAYDKSEKKKHEIAKNIVGKIWKGEEYAALSVQNLSEFFTSITIKRKSLSAKEASEVVHNFTEVSCWQIFHVTEASIRLAASISANYAADYYDSLIAAVMKEHGIKEIITENEKDFTKIPGIKVINPFK